MAVVSRSPLRLAACTIGALGLWLAHPQGQMLPDRQLAGAKAPSPDAPAGEAGQGVIAQGSMKTAVFTASTIAFPNPDRGFHAWAATSDVAGYAALRAAGFTLARQYFMLDPFLEQPLPQWYLDSLSQEFAFARQAGVKHIVRFAYNFGPYPDPAPDATQSRIEQHLHQLTPLLAANEDVISSFEAGFIGAWGEWHSSTNGLDTDPGAKAAILAALMAAVPPSRMIALRYPSDMQLLNGPPITQSEAFSGSRRARVGSHQDCFLASDNDGGTWGRGGNTIAADKAYIAENGRWAVVGGETCNPNPPRSLCPTALAELEYLHFSNLGVDYEPAVIQGFKDGGCYDEIDRRLGYRFEVASVSYAASAASGAILPVTVTLRNVGYAAMFNARPVFAVLSGGNTRLVTPLTDDPRTWAAGATHTLRALIPLPATIAPGTYTLSLWLPDQNPSLGNDPRFAVRFANEGVWDAATGENVLARDITVSSTNVPEPPTNFRVAGVAGNHVTLAWTPPTSGVAPTGFLLEGGTAPGQVLDTLPLGLTASVTLPAPTGLFYLRLRTVAGALTSVASNESQVYVNVPTPPAPPSGLLGLVVGDALSLAWRNPTGGGALSTIVLDVSGGASASVPLGVVDTFTIAGIQPGTYTFSVRAGNTAGISTASNSVTLTFPSVCSGSPLPPVGFTATRAGSVVTLAWELAATGPAPTGFLMHVSGAFEGSLPTAVRTLTGPVGSGTYTVSVAATNPCGVSAPTASRTLTVP
jgi:hypothetical protein